MSIDPILITAGIIIGTIIFVIGASYAIGKEEPTNDDEGMTQTVLTGSVRP